MSIAPTVSVIMPFLNSERFIEESILSVVQQSRGDWELLLVDDGSTDASGEIAEQYAAADPRIRLHSHPNGASLGASAARNRGVAEARGRFLTFLDADDVWVPGKLEAQLPLLEQAPEAVMLHSNTLFWSGWTGEGADARLDHLPDLGVPVGRTVPGRELLRLWITGLAAPPCTCAALVRRDVVEQVGGWEESFRYVYTDQAFFSKVMLRGDVLVAPGCWDWYRQHPASSVKQAAGRGELDAAHRRFLDWLVEYLERTGEGATPLAAAVRSELRWLDRPAWQRNLRRRLGTKMVRRARRIARSLSGSAW